MTTPWLSTLVLPLSDSELAARVRIPAQEVAALTDFEPAVGAAALAEAFKAFYEPVDQDLELIREIVNAAYAHALSAYSSMAEFRRRAQERPSFAPEARTRMLTGPSGVGKSCLFRAVGRLLRNDALVDAGPDLPSFPIRPVAHVLMRPKITDHDLLEAVAEGIGVTLGTAKVNRSLIAHLQQRAYQRGFALCLADEMQFVARSAGASSLAAHLISTLGSLGPPVFYAANYSLGHKLSARPPEDQARFLSEPLVLLPLLPGDSGFESYCEGARTILGERLEFDSTKHGEEFHAMTGGMRRMMARLFIGAYRVSAEERRTTSNSLRVTIDHIRVAHKSIQYSQDRISVAACHQAALGGKVPMGYVCPFPLPPVQARRVHQASEIHQRTVLNVAVSKHMASAAERDIARVQAASKQTFKPVPASKEAKPKKAALSPEGLLKGLSIPRPPTQA